MLQKSEMDAFLKEYWTPARLDENILTNHPLMAMMSKDTEAGGEKLIVPIDLDDGADGGPDFATAQERAQNTSSKKRQFVFDYVEDFQMAQVENKIIRLTRKTPQLALEKAVKESKRAMRILSRRNARSLYRSGWGDLGVIADTTVTTGDIIRLTNISDARNFQIGQLLQFSASLNSDALRDSGDTLEVKAIDVDTGYIQVTAANMGTTVTGIQAGDVIFLAGAREDSATPTPLMIHGVGAFVPLDPPGGSDSFGGVNRSVWPNRLAGLRYDARNKPLDQAIIKALVHANTNEAYPEKLFLASDVYGDFLQMMEGRHEKIQEKVGKIGFNGIEIQTGYGSNGVKVFPDGDCPSGLGYALEMDAWKIHSAGELIQNDLQYGEGRDLESGSGVEFRYVSTFQVSCDRPAGQMVIRFA